MIPMVSRKPYYRLAEVAARWSMTPSDIASFVLEGELVLSIAVSQLRVETGTHEVFDDKQRCAIPTGRRSHSGTLDLRRDDAWAALTVGSCGVTSFKAAADEYVDFVPDDDDGSLHVEAESLVIRRAEIDRFEAASGTFGCSPPWVAGDVVELPATGRGVQPTHDWEAFWVETCRTLYFEGVPETQAALIRRLQDWFDAAGKKVPDDSTLKKKLKPVWSLFKPEAARKSA
jgi:hypothetical protein